MLIDRKGNIRYEGAGEFHVGDQWYKQWDARIQELLAEQVASVEVHVIPVGDNVVVRASPRSGNEDQRPPGRPSSNSHRAGPSA